MLPSDRSERRFKRYGIIIIIIMALIFLIWMVSFIARFIRGSVAQHTLPGEDSRRPVLQFAARQSLPDLPALRFLGKC